MTETFRLGAAVWVRMYRGQQEVRVPATIIALQEGAGGYVVRGDGPCADGGEPRTWMTVESQLAPRETVPRACPGCAGVLTRQACAECDATGRVCGVGVDDVLWSDDCAWCAGIGSYPLCEACGWGGDECPDTC